MGTVATTESVSKEEMPYGENSITIVDTPPLSSKETLAAIIKNDLSMHQQKIAVYAIVIAIGRFTQEEETILDGLLSNSFMQGRTIFIFTRKNELEGLNCREEDSLARWLDSEPTIRRWMRQYKINKYFAIENTCKSYDRVFEMLNVAININDNKNESVSDELFVAQIPIKRYVLFENFNISQHISHQNQHKNCFISFMSFIRTLIRKRFSILSQLDIFQF